jgi:hypothetical protein
MYQLYHTWIHPLHHSPLPLLPPIHEIVSRGIIFCIYMYVYNFLACIHPPIPFPTTSPLPMVPTIPSWAGPLLSSYFLISQKRKEKRVKKKRKTWHFCLFEIKVAIQGASLWYFHIYMCYTPNWFISSNFLHSALLTFLQWFQLVYLRFLYSFLCREHITHVQLLSFLLLPYSFSAWPPLSVASVS